MMGDFSRGDHHHPIQQRTGDAIGASTEDEKNYELNEEEKKELMLFWSQFVLGGDQKISENTTALNNEELVKQLYASLENGVDKLLTKQPDGWDLIDPELLIEKSKNDKDFALQYCQQVNDCFTKTKAQITLDISSKWDQTPADMRRSGQFCCAGTSLVGSFYLDKANLEHYICNPPGHVANIVKDRDGSWLYVDFMLGVVDKIEEFEEKEIEGVKTFHIKQIGERKVDTLMPLWPKEFGNVSVILGNYQAMQEEAELMGPKDNIPADEVELAKRKVNEIEQFRQKDNIKLDFDEINSKLLRRSEIFEKSEEMKQERTKLKKLEKF